VAGFARWANAAPGPAEQTRFMWVGFGDHRLYTADGDWRYGFDKTECGPAQNGLPALSTMVGLSAAVGGPFSLLCATSNVIDVDYAHGVSVWFGPGSDRRRDTSTGDWAYGYDKGECGPNEVLTGVARQAQSINEFRCSPATTTMLGSPLQATSCSVVDFNRHDGYDPFPGSNRGDWAYTYDKGNCAANRYIKGFAVAKGQPPYYYNNKILCCGAQLTARAGRCNADEQCASGVCAWFGLCL